MIVGDAHQTLGSEYPRQFEGDAVTGAIVVVDGRGPRHATAPVVVEVGRETQAGAIGTQTAR